MKPHASGLGTAWVERDNCDGKRPNKCCLGYGDGMSRLIYYLAIVGYVA